MVLQLQPPALSKIVCDVFIKLTIHVNILSPIGNHNIPFARASKSHTVFLKNVCDMVTRRTRFQEPYDLFWHIVHPRVATVRFIVYDIPF
jgi:hypothetical protein